ncbi:hypothetical protein ACFQY7_50550 [Actinomadura luteofluorescens]|uniref:hypothetical protein n=1 Tax=Actinomadura luteofluorescens TaxID=46163 RepID=UPI00363554DF
MVVLFSVVAVVAVVAVASVRLSAALPEAVGGAQVPRDVRGRRAGRLSADPG